MAEDLLRYDKMVENALRSVVKTALAQVSDHGLPGDHSLYVTFRTAEGDVPARLREAYPEEMTIVVEHQFWDLETGDDQFSVTLSFNGIRERLTVPFSAVTAFADPSQNFGLKFEADDADLSLQTLADGEGPSDDQPAAEDGDKAPEDGENVVALDTFRKK